MPKKPKICATRITDRDYEELVAIAKREDRAPACTIRKAIHSMLIAYGGVNKNFVNTRKRRAS